MDTRHMRVSITGLQILAAGLFLILLSSAARGGASSGEIQALLDGPEDEETVLSRLGALSVGPGKLAETLRSWRPGRRPFTGDFKKVPLEGGDGRKTELCVYVPKAYDGKKAWPLILVLHGLGGHGRQMIDVLRPVADRYGMLVAAPSAKKFEGMMPMFKHWWRYTPDSFPLAALAWMRRHFNIDDDRVLLSGYSMGGFGTWNLGLRFPDRFCALAPFAGGISRMEYMVKRDSTRRELLANAALLPVTFVHGDKDGIVPVRIDRMTHEELTKAGIAHTYHEIPGGLHLLKEVLAVQQGDFKKAWVVTELFDKLKTIRRAGLNASFSFTTLEAPARARSVSIDEMTDTHARVMVTMEKNAVRLKTKNVKKLTLYFDGMALPLDPAPEITLNGKKVLSKKLKPALRTVVRSWRTLRDRKRIFVASLSLPVGGEEE